MGAVLFYHPQPQDNILMGKVSRYGLPNSVGVTLEYTMVVGDAHLQRQPPEYHRVDWALKRC